MNPWNRLRYVYTKTLRRGDQNGTINSMLPHHFQNPEQLQNIFV